MALLAGQPVVVELQLHDMEQNPSQCAATWDLEAGSSTERKLTPYSSGILTRSYLHSLEVGCCEASQKVCQEISGWRLAQPPNLWVTVE